MRKPQILFLKNILLMLFKDRFNHKVEFFISVNARTLVGCSS